MVWVVASRNFSWKPNPRTTIDFREGQVYNMPRASADELIGAGKVHVKNKDEPEPVVSAGAKARKMKAEVEPDEPVGAPLGEPES